MSYKELILKPNQKISNSICIDKGKTHYEASIKPAIKFNVANAILDLGDRIINTFDLLCAKRSDNIKKNEDKIANTNTNKPDKAWNASSNHSAFKHFADVLNYSDTSLNCQVYDHDFQRDIPGRHRVKVSGVGSECIRDFATLTDPSANTISLIAITIWLIQFVNATSLLVN